MKRKTILCAFLAGLFLCSCGSPVDTGKGSDSPGEEVISSEPDAQEEVEETTISFDPEIEAVDCEGATYTILSRLCDGSTYCYPYHEFSVEDINGETVNDAVFQRNAAVEGKYNLAFSLPEEPDVIGTARRSVNAGEQLYDLLISPPSSTYVFSVEGELLNLRTVPWIDTEQPYWRSSITKSTSVAGKNYFAIGDLNLAALNGVGVVFFNKEVAEEMQIGDLYETVRAGKWTFDTFTEYCKGVTTDLNGDGVLNSEDKFGLTTNGFAWQPLFAGTASSIIPKDADDIPVFDWDSEWNIDVITRIIGLVNDINSTILVNQHKEIPQSEWGLASIRMFGENRALFWIEIIYGVHEQRNMDKDFGILPTPKYDESQQSYASYIHTGWTSCTCIPVTNANLDLAGRIIEDLAYQSSVSVRPAYYDVTLKGKVSRDNDSGEMLDIIYSNINLDLAILLAERLPVDNDMRSFLINNNTDFVSKIASEKKMCVKTLEKDVKTLSEMDH